MRRQDKFSIMDSMMTRRAANRWAVLLLLVHGIMALDAAWRNSPTWDEISYPAAGYDLLRSGHIRINFEHPPLGKILYALPLLPLRLGAANPSTGLIAADPIRYGFHFVYHNTQSPLVLTVLPRLVAVCFSLGLALLLFGALVRRWGPSAGCLGLCAYAFAPPIVARASLALLEMPLAFFMLGAAVSYVAWREDRRPRDGLICLFCGLCALLTKATALMLLPVFLLAALTEARGGRALARRVWEITSGVLLLLALCEGLTALVGWPYHRILLVNPRIQELAGLFQGPSRSAMPVYFHGATWDQAKNYFALAAWIIKTPVPLLVLAALGAAIALRRRPNDRLAVLGISFFLVCGILMTTVHSVIATAHYFILWPVACLLAGVCAADAESRPARWGVVVLLVLLATLSGRVHPNHLAYFNEIIGGSSQGYRWLADSDQDWGQALPSLARYLRARASPHLILAYSGAGDPRAYGLAYQDLFSPAVVSGEFRGETIPSDGQSIYLALATKVIQSEPEAMDWALKNLKSQAMPGYCFLVYDITREAEAYRWMAGLYEATRRPLLARWALQRAAAFN
jgi:4-amino-4-deoxy-L-arabinose transferase-like glycosyltransferase